MNDAGIAIVTPSFARDYELCRALNESVLRFVPAPVKHYIFVDRCDLQLFASLQNSRTIVAAVEEIIPRGYVKVPRSKRWWFSFPACFPAKGWLVQQLVKLSAARVLEEQTLVCIDSDVRFIRPADTALFARDGKTRLYRKPGGVVAGMEHVTWHRNICRMLGVEPDPLPMDDYVGNVISWDRRIALEACAHVEAVTGKPWHIAFTHARLVSEYMLYGLYVQKVTGIDAARLWVDERSWCHTYWGPDPLREGDVERFVSEMKDDDVAFSIAGYSATEERVAQAALQLAANRPPVGHY
ncbi:MAG TPA: DUF6492 family protein [Candidatus Acidoferrales bacterium]|nr:DUF6492 family protein [Candidatus Acidoferrales bacterium]